MLYPEEKGLEQSKCLTLSGQTGERLVQPQLHSAGAFASGSQLESSSPEPYWEGSKNKTSRPYPKCYNELQLDPSIIHDGWLDFLSSKRLVTLARGLSPAFLRFGGKRTDFLQFQNLRNPAKSRGGPGPDYYLKNYEDDIVRSDVALDKQKGCKIAQHPDVMLELQREKAAQMHLVLLKEQFSNTYSNLILTG
ncbi:hypothetical protein CapIbe_021396 [Capra ibex]